MCVNIISAFKTIRIGASIDMAITDEAVLQVPLLMLKSTKRTATTTTRSHAYMVTTSCNEAKTCSVNIITTINEYTATIIQPRDKRGDSMLKCLIFCASITARITKC